jgi:hypothetical protein
MSKLQWQVPNLPAPERIAMLRETEAGPAYIF